MRYSITRVEKMYKDVQVPENATGGSAGFDLRAYLNDVHDSENVKNIIIYPNNSFKIKTGLRIKLPHNICCELYLKKFFKEFELIGRPIFFNEDELSVVVKNISNKKIILNNNDIIGRFLFFLIKIGGIDSEN